MKRCIERARAGDVAAKEDLVYTLRPRIAKMAAYYARCSGEDADDLLQEAWIGLLEALREVDLHIGTPAQYLIRCARWRLLDAIKRAKVRRCLPLDDADNLPSSDTPESEAAVARACVSVFSSELKDTQRRVLDCLMDGLTWREAGSVLGCTSANIAHHVRQIRRRYEAWSDEQAGSQM